MRYGSVTLGQVEAICNKLGGEEGVKRFLAGDTVIAKASKMPALPLLQLLGTISLPAVLEGFVVNDRFKVGTFLKKLKISYVDDRFMSWFGSKTEDAREATELRRHQLLRDEMDSPIIVELGGEGKVETTVSAIYALMEKQGKGEDGSLLTNGYVNIFYVRDVFGGLRVVHIYWSGDGWDVRANSAGSPVRWHAGRRVFSSNSGI